jgi:uncharacterized protein (DUF1015 family)
VTDIGPFRALRYDPSRVDLSSVLAPVYDVVAPEDRARLWDSHPHAAVKLELTRDAADEATTDYTDVGERLTSWQADGVLQREETPAVYVLRQRFTAPDGRELARLGFFAELRLEDYEARVVRPHERTLAGPKADRLKILRATRTNLSSVFMLYEDRDRKLDVLLENALESGEIIRSTDTAGVVNEMVVLQEPAAIEELRAFMAPRPVVIADGHHRYETALGFRAECRAAGETGEAASPERLLSYFANAYAEGTLLLPIHRLVREAPAPDAASWERLEASGWTCREQASAEPEAMQALLKEHLEPLADRFAFAADDGSGTLRIFSRPADEELSVRVIHREVLGGVFGLDDAALREGAVSFPKSTIQVARDLAAGKGTVALYLNALSPDDVFSVTEAGETLPQKSTFFAPKLPTGLVFRRLDAPGETA